MSPTAEQLAKAMRSGLQLRWSIPPASENGSFPPQGCVRSFLEPYADALHYRLPHRRHRLDRLIRAWHYFIRLLIAPWLHVQSRFNRSTVGVIEQVEQRVRALEEAERALRRSVALLQQTLLDHAENEISGHIDSPEKR